MSCSCGHTGTLETYTPEEWLSHFEEEDRDAEAHLSASDAALLRQEHDRFRAALAKGLTLNPAEMRGHALWEDSLRRIR